MSCRYYFYCPTCEKSSREIGTNNPVACGNFLNTFYMYDHAVLLLNKAIGECCYNIDSGDLNLQEANNFFDAHKWCLEQNDYLLLNEWGEICIPYEVKIDFGFGGTYKKLEKED